MDGAPGTRRKLRSFLRYCSVDIMLSHPSPNHPPDQDLSVGTPVARWMGHRSKTLRQMRACGQTTGI
jgi:hypothetical protein